jgi:signal peptidase I
VDPSRELPKDVAVSKSAPPRRTDPPLAVSNAKLLRYVFWTIWFILVPAALAYASVWLLKPPDALPPAGAIAKLRWLVQDQPVPAGIVLFTLFEMALYHWRHYLPLATVAGIGGRSDLSRELRREYEHAAQLLDEAERILSKRRAAVERHVPSGARNELTDALDALREAMDSEPLDETRFGDTHERASRLVARHLGRWQKSELREYAESIGIAVGVALLLRAFVVEAFKIPSGSMLPTLQIQDHIFVNKFVYGPTLPFVNARVFENLPPRHGDVMVFANPQNPNEDFIKRVIALPGDTLEVDNGHPIINGWQVPRCLVGDYDFREGAEFSTKRGELYVEFLGEYSYLTLFEEDRREGPQGPYTAKAGEVWVLGDNRNNSSDSRAWFGGRGGGVPFANIRGRAMFVWLSFDPDGGFAFDRWLTNVMGKPRLPKGAAPELFSGIEKCLAERPPVEKTTPPPPKN